MMDRCDALICRVLLHLSSSLELIADKQNLYCDLANQATGYEEYYDYIFPDETGAAPNLKILEAAYRWKRQKMDTENQDDDGEDAPTEAS